MYKVGICGVGFVGNAILQFLIKADKNIKEVVAYDKYKCNEHKQSEHKQSEHKQSEHKCINDFDKLLSTDLLYICLPTPYSTHLKTYYLKEINTVLEALAISKYTGLILIKSTVLPDYCKKMNELYPELLIVHNPEFLTARTAVSDFAAQKHIVLGFTKQSERKAYFLKNFYLALFPEASISITESENSALMKLSCNSFYATKIQFFTELYLLCEQMKISYDEVKDLMLKNEWINPQHTNVPGPDDRISFGGDCFPKDISALSAYMELQDIPNMVIKASIMERNEMRDD
jgi:UDPglucose 6-dehydrogenase